jgi:hypothetical protein
MESEKRGRKKSEAKKKKGRPKKRRAPAEFDKSQTDGIIGV